MKETLRERIEYYQELLPSTYPDRFPDRYELRPSGWVLERNVVERPDLEIDFDGGIQRIRPIGTLDVEFLSDDIVDRARSGTINLVTHYPCGLKCPGCFSEEAIFGDAARLLKWREVMKVVDAARSIGLTSIKFLGPGELFQNPDLFHILDACESRGLPIGIFTKGAELGDDELAQRNFGHLGITTSTELASRIARYESVRIYLGFNSFMPERQDAMVGSSTAVTSYRLTNGVFESRGIARYTEKRDRALRTLFSLGFAAPERGQRLVLVMAPIQKNQIDEVAELYEWAARRNMPLVIAPTMESGPKAQGLVRVLQAKDPDNKWLDEVYRRVYARAFHLGISSPERLADLGLSPYIGIEGCNQVANGLMMRLNGQIKICPGSSRAAHIYGSVWSSAGVLDPQNIIRIWRSSPSYRLGNLHNNWCPAKTQMLPQALRARMMSELCAPGACDEDDSSRINE